MKISSSVAEFGVRRVIDSITDNPEKNIPRLMTWVDRLSNGEFETQRAVVRKAVYDKDNPYHDFIYKTACSIDKETLKTFVVNFIVHANLEGWEKQQYYRDTYNCNVPWAILLDPTSACNLHCTGCWAAEYGNKLNLTFDEIDDIINQGKALGVYFYIYTGGEPLVRKKDLIALCEKHPDCEFLSFTNGTLIDEAFVADMLRVKNFIPAISIEGFEEATDNRRGQGTYGKATHAMSLLKQKHLPFGISCCYTRPNFESITSEAFFDHMIELGSLFVWYFHYMPVGNDASVDLLPTPDQRKEMIHRLRDFRSRKPMFAIDFQNDGEYVEGCIAGGRRYLHINANGDIDPCVFIHYSDSNIREKSLLDALRSPLFMAYHDGQPFNDNMLRPCPMLENPQYLRDIVARTHAKSTDLQSPESAEHLCAKCDGYAADWAPEARSLWEGSPNEAHFKAKAERNRAEDEARLAKLKAKQKKSRAKDPVR
ncbi:radical SAM protein [Oscillospiraceae bacterium HV4-5-C5C]|nr:radical SAM protein [Oscillospiraceae bacterium HV4-5-C5C]